VKNVDPVSSKIFTSSYYIDIKEGNQIKFKLGKFSAILPYLQMSKYG